MRSPVQTRTLVIFLAGGLWGVIGTLMSLPEQQVSQGLILRASYMAHQADQRPFGLSALNWQAGRIWDRKRADGFAWGHYMAVVDPRACPGDHGPFLAGCIEAAKHRGRLLASVSRAN